MTPAKFPESNTLFGPPPDLTDSQCRTIHAYQGEVRQGSVDGAPVIVTAWQPNTVEIERIKSGQPIYLSFLGGMPPHYACTSFEEAISIA